MTKTVVIGLDGADWEHIEDNLDELPTFKKIKREGSWGTLKTERPPATIPGWNCLTTGKDVSNLEKPSLFQVDEGTFKAHKGETEPEIWDITSEFDMENIIINVPTIRSAYGIKGQMVAGPFSSGQITHPKDLKGELDEVCDGYEAYWSSPDKDSERLDEVKRMIRKRYRAFEYLLDNYNSEFFFCAFMGPDRICHTMLKYVDEEHPFYTKKRNEEYGNSILEVYKELDKYIEKILERLGNVNVFFVSDHGMNPCRVFFNVNDWLKKEGYIELEEQNDSFNFRSRLYELGLDTIRKFGLMSYIPNFLMSRKLRGKFRTDYKSLDETNIDWKNTKAFCDDANGAIRINLKGRERNGSVKEENYERIRNKLIGDLEEFSDENNLNITIHKKEDLYSGKYLDEKPDLYVELDGYRGRWQTSIGHKKLITPSTTGGCHSLYGFFGAIGPDIKDGFNFNTKSINIAPTILHTLGCKIPRDINGEVLKSIFKDESKLKGREVEKTEKIEKKRGDVEYSKEDDEEIRERMKALGYLD